MIKSSVIQLQTFRIKVVLPRAGAVDGEHRVFLC